MLDHAQTFKAGVAEFDAGDTLDLASFAFAGATLSWKGGAPGLGGALTVTSGADTASIHLNDDHARHGFHLADDGHGGVNLTYGAPAAAHLDAFAI